MPQIKESEIQGQIIKYLEINNCEVVNIVTTGIFDPRTKSFRKAPVKGLADIFYSHKHSPLAGWIEVKTPREYIWTMNQIKRFQNEEGYIKEVLKKKKKKRLYEQWQFIERMKNTGLTCFFTDGIEKTRDNLKL